MIIWVFFEVFIVNEPHCNNQKSFCEECIGGIGLHPLDDYHSDHESCEISKLRHGIPKCESSGIRRVHILRKSLYKGTVTYKQIGHPKQDTMPTDP